MSIDLIQERKFVERDAARLLGVSVRTLQRWRLEGRGPGFCRLGDRAIRYCEGDLQSFLEAGHVDHRGTGALATVHGQGGGY